MEWRRVTPSCSRVHRERIKRGERINYCFPSPMNSVQSRIPIFREFIPKPMSNFSMSSAEDLSDHHPSRPSGLDTELKRHQDRPDHLPSSQITTWRSLRCITNASKEATGGNWRARGVVGAVITLRCNLGLPLLAFVFVRPRPPLSSPMVAAKKTPQPRKTKAPDEASAVASSRKKKATDEASAVASSRKKKATDAASAVEASEPPSQPEPPASARRR